MHSPSPQRFFRALLHLYLTTFKQIHIYPAMFNPVFQNDWTAYNVRRYNGYCFLRLHLIQFLLESSICNLKRTSHGIIQLRYDQTLYGKIPVRVSSASHHLVNAVMKLHNGSVFPGLRLAGTKSNYISWGINERRNYDSAHRLYVIWASRVFSDGFADASRIIYHYHDLYRNDRGRS